MRIVYGVLSSVVFVRGIRLLPKVDKRFSAIGGSLCSPQSAFGVLWNGGPLITRGLRTDVLGRGAPPIPKDRKAANPALRDDAPPVSSEVQLDRIGWRFGTAT